MDVNEFRRAGHQAIEQVAAYYEMLQKGSDGYQVAPSMKPGDILNKIPTAPPIDPTDFAEVQKDFDDIVLPGTCHWQHPMFAAYYPANSTFESIIADIYTSATSTPGFNHSCNPASTEIEQAMTSWVGQMLGLDESFFRNGVIQGTASECALIAAIAARERVIRIVQSESSKEGTRTREEISSRLVMYGTTETHSLGAKAGLILGLPFKALETKKEDNWALTGETLRAEVEKDKMKGLIPFMIIATVGSTSSGTVDRVAEICRVSQDHRELFIHVDAAWAGVYSALPEYRDFLAIDATNKRGQAIEGTYDSTGEVHSYCTNMHKSGLVTFECSTFFIRNSQMLTEVLDVTPPFLKNQSGYGEVRDYRNWGLTLGRRFRSLKILFVLKSFGISGFQDHLRRSIALAETLEKQVGKDDRFELVTPRSLALLVIRLAPANAQGEDKLDALNRRFYANLHKRSNVQLTSTVIGGVFCIRIALGNPRTKEEHIQEMWRTLCEAADEELKD